MKIIEMEGKSTDEIISAFKSVYQLTDEQFRYEIVEEASKGFLNLIGNKPAKMKFFLLNYEEELKDLLREFLVHLNISYGDIIIHKEEDGYHADIEGLEDAGFMIGKEGKFLDSLQFLVNRMINKNDEEDIRVLLDVEGYRCRKAEQFTRKIDFLTQKVLRSHKSITLDPMTPAERRMVHQYIETKPQLRTMTIGEGEMKRVVISPVRTENTRTFKPRPNSNRDNNNRENNNHDHNGYREQYHNRDNDNKDNRSREHNNYRNNEHTRNKDNN